MQSQGAATLRGEMQNGVMTPAPAAPKHAEEMFPSDETELCVCA